METRKPNILDLGIVAEHDMACAVCHEKAAVLDMNKGIFQPCWACQENGYKIKKKVRLTFLEKMFRKGKTNDR